MIRKEHLIFLACAALVLVFGLLVWGRDAKALAGPVPAVDSFAITCGTDATRIVGDGVAAGGFSSLYCQNMNAEPVAIGDILLTTSTAPVICNATACPRADWPLDATLLYCRADNATSIKCIAGR